MKETEKKEVRQTDRDRKRTGKMAKCQGNK